MTAQADLPAGSLALGRIGSALAVGRELEVVRAAAFGILPKEVSVKVSLGAAAAGVREEERGKKQEGSEEAAGRRDAVHGGKIDDEMGRCHGRRTRTGLVWGRRIGIFSRAAMAA